jgi:hypothetical protein
MDVGDASLKQSEDREGEIIVPDIVPDEGVIDAKEDDSVQITIDDTESV